MAQQGETEGGARGQGAQASGTHVYGRHIAMYTTSLSNGKTKEQDMAKRFLAERRSFGGIS